MYKDSISLKKKGGFLNKYRFKLISFYLKKWVLNNVKIKRLIQLSILKLVDNNSYQGKRHLRKLPVRGQRTRTNANSQYIFKDVLIF